MPGEANIPHERPQTEIASRAFEAELARLQELEARHEREREAEIRADERRRIVERLRGTTANPAAMRRWLATHGLKPERAAVVSPVLDAIADDVLGEVEP